MVNSVCKTESKRCDMLRCIFLFSCIAIAWQTSLAADKPGSIADGELHDCQIVSIDNAWAVGDRGLILATSDAGKHWEVQHRRSEAPLYAACFSDEMNGCVLGGTIEPYSHRSAAVVLITADAGKSWQSIPNDLPRLIGAQMIGNGHLLAWGDWSNLHQSALFESHDGGQSWAGRPIPCGHIQSAAAGPDGVLVVVDREGKIHRSLNGLEFETVPLPVSPFEPIRICKNIEGAWWLGGEGGRLYRSVDAIRWGKVTLPGTAADQSLISLRAIAGHANRLWVAGYPGEVIWSSEDRGNTWATSITKSRTPINAISVLNGDLLLSCGSMANLFASRNSGKAWWAQHQSGSRNAVLNISSTCSGVAWDFMTQVMHENRRHTSALVLHDQCFEEKAGLLPELASRIEIAGKSIGLAQVRILHGFPVSNLESGIRESDLGYYAETSTANLQGKALSSGKISANEVPALLKRIVYEIRTARPEVIVSNCTTTGNPLEVKSANAVERAVALAANKEFKLFSESSGLPDEAWETKRVFVRGISAVNQYSPSMLLDANLVLGNALNYARPLIQSRGIDVPADRKFAYRFAGPHAGMMRDPPLNGIVLDPSTQIADRSEFQQPKTTLRRTSAWYGWKQLTDSESGNPLTPDRLWDSKIRAAAKEVSETALSPVLLEMAIQCRRSGDWNRWQAALDFLLERDTQSPAAEAAYWELMSHTGSIEVKRMLADQLQALEQRNAAGLSVSTSTLQQASPFARQQHESSVQPAAFSSTLRLIPVATQRDLNEFTRLLGKWPDSFLTRRADPRWGWLIASRYRGMQQRNESVNSTVNLSRRYSDYWPQLSPFIKDWNSVSNAEQELFDLLTAPPALPPSQHSPTPDTHTTSTRPPSNIPILVWTSETPHLDGKADEAFWQSATRLELRDPWATDAAMKTTIRIARDQNFLYVHSEAQAYGVTRPTKDKRKDSTRPESDLIKLRIDLDRDYASWFEIGWSASGESFDSVNEMLQWNPTWYASLYNDSRSWSTEIAIPLEQLVVPADVAGKDWTKEVWALNITRTIPGVGSHSFAPSRSDRAAADDWFLLDLGMTNRIAQ